MAKDFKSPAGSYAKGSTGETGPKQSGKPSTGFDNGSRGKLGETAPGPGVGANGNRIR